MIDRRYPYMMRIVDSPLDEFEKKRATAFAEEIKRRTDCNMCYNLRQKSLFLYYGESPDIGPIQIPFGGESGWKLDSTDIDNTVLALNMGRNRTREEKDANTERAERSQKIDAEQEKEKRLEDLRPRAEEIAGRLDKTRRGVKPITVTMS